MITLDNLSLNFSNNHNLEPTAILSPLNLRLEEKDFTMILGPSGCGKSSLLRVIMGLQKPTTGSISYTRGSSTQSDRVPSPRLGVVFQEPTLIPWQSVFNNVQLPLELQKKPYKIPKSEWADRIHDVLKLVGLEGSTQLFPHQLSGGMKMRVALARALVHEPQWLLLDEPFSALDETNRERLQLELWSIHKRAKIPILFVTHSLSEAVFLGSRLLYIQGRPGKMAIDEPIRFCEERTDESRSSAEYFYELKRLRHLCSLLKESGQ